MRARHPVCSQPILRAESEHVAERIAYSGELVIARDGTARLRITEVENVSRRRRKRLERSFHLYR
jgi:hypothetical protein